MIFADLVAGDSVFVDANTLVYHFQPHPVFGLACTDLVERIEHQNLVGFTSTHVLSEMAHRLMTMEASALFGWPFAGIGSELAAVMMEQAFDWLDAPVARVAGVDVPLPYAANLERLALPHPEQIVAAARQVSYRG